MKAAACIYTLLLAGGLLIPIFGLDAQTTTANPPTEQSKSKRSLAKQQLSDQEIADARAKGLVWVNTATRVYYKEGPFYGTTRHGKFLAEEDARKAGFRIASQPGNQKARKQHE